ncbi:hypothetical protein FPRO05_05791 [Fusarium proliferatum]|uniref:Uncharacterized protein n=1 Tax=Gibberella intermedia TaxID=948311 RepID=A0A365MN00_GIBIN|nr:hypothetical protein FPRO05_05791 [Fusarium proliferatum]
MERLAITKWIPQLCAEIGLPHWMQDELREICVLEIIKTYPCQPFNWPRVSPWASTPSHTRTPWRPAHDAEARRDMGPRAKHKTNGISNF